MQFLKKFIFEIANRDSAEGGQFIIIHPPEQYVLHKSNILERKKQSLSSWKLSLATFYPFKSIGY